MPVGAKGSVIGFYRRVTEEVGVMFDNGSYITVPGAILLLAPEPRQQEEDLTPTA